MRLMRLEVTISTNWSSNSPNRGMMRRLASGDRAVAIPAIERGDEVGDIANVAVFLASPAADYVHGTSLLVDGGWCAR